MKATEFRTVAVARRAAQEQLVFFERMMAAKDAAARPEVKVQPENLRPSPHRPDGLAAKK